MWLPDLVNAIQQQMGETWCRDYVGVERVLVRSDLRETTGLGRIARIVNIYTGDEVPIIFTPILTRGEPFVVIPKTHSPFDL